MALFRGVDSDVTTTILPRHEGVNQVLEQARAQDALGTVVANQLVVIRQQVLWCGLWRSEDANKGVLKNPLILIERRLVSAFLNKK